MLPIAAGMLLTAKPAVALTPRIGTKLVVAAGLGVVSLALFRVSGFDVNTDDSPLALTLGLLGAGIGLAMAGRESSNARFARARRTEQAVMDRKWNDKTRAKALEDALAAHRRRLAARCPVSSGLPTAGPACVTCWASSCPTPRCSSRTG